MNRLSINRRYLYVLVLLILVTVSCAITPTTPTVISPTPAPSPVPKMTSDPATTAADDELRLTFFRKGGVWSFRVNSVEDPEWLVVVLGKESVIAQNKRIQIGSAQAEIKNLDFASMSKVTSLLNSDRGTILNFFHLYANGIEQGEFSAFLIKSKPVEKNGEMPILGAVSLSKQEFQKLIMLLK